MRDSAVTAGMSSDQNRSGRRIASRGRAAPRRGRVRGFTLIEIVVAFSILALGLGIAMQIATGALRNARVAAQRTEAALYAQSLLDGAGVGERLEEGESHGDFGDDYRWTLIVDKHEVELEGAGTGIDPGMTPIQLYRLELVVTWGRDREHEQEARFVTLRALTPELGG
jgi:general secretion pathway protein I